MTAICPACGKTARIPDGFTGTTVRCPACQTRFDIAEQADPATEPTLSKEFRDLKRFAQVLMCMVLGLSVVVAGMAVYLVQQASLLGVIRQKVRWGEDHWTDDGTTMLAQRVVTRQLEILDSENRTRVKIATGDKDSVSIKLFGLNGKESLVIDDDRWGPSVILKDRNEDEKIMITHDLTNMWSEVELVTSRAGGGLILHCSKYGPNMTLTDFPGAERLQVGLGTGGIPYFDTFNTLQKGSDSRFSLINYKGEFTEAATVPEKDSPYGRKEVPE